MGSGVSLEGDVSDGATGDSEPPRPVQTTRSHLLSLSGAHNKFSMQLYLEFVKDGKRSGNIALGTISVSLGLGLLYIGSTGHTLDELHKVLHLADVTREHLLPAYAAMHWDVLRSSFPKGCLFEVAIRLFAQPEICLTPHYEDLCMHYEISRLKQADFRNRPDLARKNINQWTEERTNKRIKDVIPMGIVDRETRMLVLCATYLRTHWLHPFDHRKNYDGIFQLALKETQKVRVMCQTKPFRYFQSNRGDCEVVELPFANSYMRLLIFLPRKSDGLGKLESKLDRKLLDNVHTHLAEEMVEVHLPKFRYELGVTLGESLQKLGAKTIFVSGKADFSRITTSQRDLHVSRIFHHVTLEFDEGVTNSTPSGSAGKHAVPGDDEPQCSSQSKPRVVRCDRPFFFIVRDDRSGAIYFLGRVVRPLPAS